MRYNVLDVPEMPAGRCFEQVATCDMRYKMCPKYLQAGVLSMLQHALALVCVLRMPAGRCFVRTLRHG